MADSTPFLQSLDELAERALAGDGRAESALFSTLRVRFLDIAKRRVQDSDLEDVTQEALRIIHAKYSEKKSDRGMLPWSCAVLRNVIGNYYQAMGARRRREQITADPRAFPVRDEGTLPGTAALESAETRERVVEAITILSRRHPRCGLVFRRILENLERGGDPREVTRRAIDGLLRDDRSLKAGNLYVILHRCRAHLREIVEEMAGEVDHE